MAHAQSPQAGSTELLTIQDAQLHEVLNGTERLVEWGNLRVVTHTSEHGEGLWIQIGKTEWAVNTAMPTLEAAPNTFMFALEKGRFYSILLASGTPEDISLTFREILHECTAFEVAGVSKLNEKDREEIINQVAQEVANDEELDSLRPNIAPGASPTTSQRILQEPAPDGFPLAFSEIIGDTAGAAFAQEKLLASANWASRKIIEQTDAYQAKHEATQDPVKISPHIQRTVKLARRAAETGSSWANKIAGGIADISIKIADAVIRHLGPSKYGEELSDPNKRPNAAKEVASAALLAATGIYDSMEQASRVVLNAGGQASSNFIGHKYGAEAGQLTKDATAATVTGGMTVLTVQKLGLKKIARRVAKRTAHGLVKAYVLPGQGSGTAQAGQQQSSGQASAQQPVAGAQAQAGVYGAPPGQATASQTGTQGVPLASNTSGQNLGRAAFPTQTSGQYGAPPGRGAAAANVPPAQSPGQYGVPPGKPAAQH